MTHEEEAKKILRDACFDDANDILAVEVHNALVKPIAEALASSEKKGRELGAKAQYEMLMKLRWNQAIEEAVKVADEYDAYKTKCNDGGHDKRWCSYCAARNDGVNEIASQLEKLKRN